MMNGMPSAMKFQRPRMQIKAFSVGYLGGKIFVVWGMPHEAVTDFILYRNGIEIASTKNLKEGEEFPFQHPELFDRDHHTNLFRKDSPYKLLYIDENVHKFQTYEYKVVCEKRDQAGKVLETYESREVSAKSE